MLGILEVAWMGELPKHLQYHPWALKSWDGTYSSLIVGQLPIEDVEEKWEKPTMFIQMTKPPWAVPRSK